jgi:hypothetical protein
MARRWAEEQTFAPRGEMSAWRFQQTPYGFQVLDEGGAEVRWCGKATLTGPPRRFRDDASQPRQVEIESPELKAWLMSVHEAAQKALGTPLDPPMKTNMFGEAYIRAKEYPQSRWQDAEGAHVPPESFEPGEVWVMVRVVPYSLTGHKGLSVRLLAMQR